MQCLFSFKQFYYQEDAASRRRRRRRDTSSETKVTVTNNQTVLIPKDLASQTSYSFYVKAANDWMEGDASETQTFQTKPSGECLIYTYDTG